MSKAEKIFVMGIDGMDPNTTRRLIDEGKMPNFKKFMERGGMRADLHMMGGVPTITPPMWATLATGCSPNVHGITCFWNPSHEKLDELVYAFDSGLCKAERMWEVFAEAGKKTMVFHWPAGAWPPHSDLENLHVIDGTQPGCINTGHAQLDNNKIITADDTITEVGFEPAVKVNNGAGCMLSDVDENKDADEQSLQEKSTGGGNLVNIMTELTDGEGVFEEVRCDVCNSPLRPIDKEKWPNAPEGTKEFTILFYKGLVRRLGLLIPNENGIYDRVEVYARRGDEKPLAVVTKDKRITFDYYDELRIDDKKHNIVRYLSILDIADDGSKITLDLGPALDIDNDEHFYPKSLYKKMIDACGDLVAPAQQGGPYPNMVENSLLPSWKHLTEWQGKAVNFLMDEGYEVIFSHFHNIDSVGHQYWHWCKKRNHGGEHDPEQYLGYFEEIYLQTDYYMGQVLDRLDDGWTIFVVSDHGLMIREEEQVANFGDPFGINAKVMADLGYTVLKKDENGKTLKEIDWTKTKAVAQRGNYIYINLKGKYDTGIVDPEDKYELEEEIIDALYNYRDPDTGKRIVSLVIRNKEAALIGMSGEECGDLIYFIREGVNRIHGDSMPTYVQYKNTTVAPIFMAAGPGIKEGFFTDRVIREMDVTPTIAAAAGVRMPAQCEGAPAYQILDQ